MLGRHRRVRPAPTDGALRLTRRTADREVVRAWSLRAGGTVPLPVLLDDLDRRARPTRPARPPVGLAFAWDEDDVRTSAWMPQGVSTSADSRADGLVAGRRVVVAGWYLQTSHGPDQAARVSFADVTDPSDVRYRHVLLVECHTTGRGVRARPVHAHAGGLAWYGDLLYVASTYAGVRVFDLADLTRVDPARHHGHGYALPQRWVYRPAPSTAAPLRFSFLSVDRSSTPASLVAGEYGRSEGTRIARFGLGADGHLVPGPDGDPATTRATCAVRLDVRSMQGVACLHGTCYVTASNGRRGRGDLWVGTLDDGMRRHRGVLPPGPEDLSASPAHGALWTQTEWPGLRLVLMLRAGDWSR